MMDIKGLLERIFDILISLIGLLILFLLLPFIGLLIKLDSRGPIFYRCDRVGKDEKIFKMYKFRTMYVTPVELGHSVCPYGDPRVTSVGRLLRRTKLNELPQVINIMKGDMTLVGPRPEAPDLAALYPEAAKPIFSVKPGLVGPNQIMGRNEEELYPAGADPVMYYINHILPDKLILDLEFINDKSVIKNLKYIFLGIKVTISGAITRQHLIDNRSQLLMLLTDIFMCLFSFLLAHYLRFEIFTEPFSKHFLYSLFALVIIVRIPIFIYFGFYHSLIRFISFYDIKMVIKGVALSSVFLICISFLFGLSISGYSRAVFIIDWFCLTSFLVGYRALLKKLYLMFQDKHFVGQKKRVLIWGAGDAGELCLRFLQKDKQTDYDVIGFIDDAPLKRNRRLNGIKVLGNRHHLGILSRLYKIQEIFFAIHNLSQEEMLKLIDICRNLSIEPKIFQLKISKSASPLQAARG